MKPEPEISTQIRIQSDPNYWFTVEDVYLDVSADGLTISYWESDQGKDKRQNYICVGEESALAIADAIYKLFKKEDN